MQLVGLNFVPTQTQRSNPYRVLQQRGEYHHRWTVGESGLTPDGRPGLPVAFFFER